MITKDHIETLKRDGVVCVRNLLSDKWIDLLNRGVDRNIANPGPHFVDFTAQGSDARCIKDYWAWPEIPEYQEFFKFGPAGPAAGELLECDEIRWLEDQYFQKDAGAATPSPWHQDQPYYELDGLWLAMWIPLDPCGKDDALNFIAGSHNTGTLYTPKNFSEDGKNYYIDDADSPLSEIPDYDSAPDTYTILKWDMEPGDVLAFNPRTVHGNKGNAGDHRARRFVGRWVSEHATYDAGVFPWATMIEGHDLKKGDRFRGDRFPLVWTRNGGLVNKSV